MAGDYTRWTFDPTKDYAEVLKQQGRVDLDADWNEQAEIGDRRWRAETIDIIGRSAVPASTPHAFEITQSGGKLLIGIGRMYVDGLLVENHGLPPDIYDASLGEVSGTAPVPFLNQPYYPVPNPLPSPRSIDLVYLDVWRREIAAIQDPSIREIALGGPDTDTRVQTVWQVKVLNGVDSQDCGATIPAWDALTAPSAGRLTTSTIAPPASPDPCILSPTGGYRGLENRLYRVEVHTAGTVGGKSPATFKWSRDNASIVSGVESISAPGGPSSVLTVTTLGRDRVLRFQAGDWVEVLDDNTEFAGDHGVLTKIISPPDQANRTITVNPAIPAGLFHPANGSRHTRVRRWDQKNTGAGSDVDAATGLIAAGLGPLDIEDGIQVSFTSTPATGLLHVGDYWLFAARTADASVEALTKAPPRGVLHHFSRLGFISGMGNEKFHFTDCRPPWPPPSGGSCCCTISVTPDDLAKTSLQAIVDGAASDTTICLQPGTYNLEKPLVVTAKQPGLTIEGCNDGATIQALAGSEGNFLDGLLVLAEASGVTLRGLTFNLPLVPFEKAGGALAGTDSAKLAAIGGPHTLEKLLVSIGIRSIASDGLTLRECNFFAALPNDAQGSQSVFSACILAGGPARGMNIQDCSFNAETFNQAAAEPFQMLIGCAIVPSTVIKKGITGKGPSFALSGTVLPCSNRDLVFRNNFFGGHTAAVLVYGETDNLRVANNEVQSAYSGIWILGRNTPPNLQPFESNSQKLVPEDTLQDPVLEIGGTIARSYPLPAAFSDPSLLVPVSGVKVRLVSPSPFPAGSLLGNFDVLNQLVAAMESAAASTEKTLDFNLAVYCTGNMVDAEVADPSLGGSGGGVLIWGDDINASKVILSSNSVTNNTTSQDQATSFMSTVIVLQIDLCVATGNIILNEATNSSPAGSFFVAPLPNQGSNSIAVTGNIFKGETDIPANWLPMNTVL